MDQKTGKSREEARLSPAFRAGRRLFPAVLLLPILFLSLGYSGLRADAGADTQPAVTAKLITVKRVIDGDTIELANGERVRYLGIDAPEMRRKVDGRWVEIHEPYAVEAYELNRRLVEGRAVRLEFDRESRDRYHRLLAYVFVKDRLVNAELISSGFVQVRLHPPNLRYADLFMKLQAEALAHQRGLWTSKTRESTP